MPTVLSAPDKWRGSATAAEVSAAVARVATRRGWRVDPAPLSDGGEGFVAVLGGANRSSAVCGPAGLEVAAAWRLHDDEASIEMAAASGLALAGEKEGNQPLTATSRGTGELIAAAVNSGARRVVIGLGGSASTDGGLGCFEVLRREARLERVDIVAACDVMVPFFGALDFAAQKGASPSDVRVLADRLERVAQMYQTEYGIDVRLTPGAGAAGGLGGALAALGASLVAGIEFVAAAIGLEERLAAADLVVTGEGRLDAHTFEGKAVGWILERAAARGLPALVIVGDLEPDSVPSALAGSDAEFVSLVERFGSKEARSNTLGCIEAVVDEYLRR